MSDNNDISNTDQRIQNIAIDSYKISRSNLRFMKTLSLFAKKTGQENELISAYYETIKDEKERLLKLLDSQMQRVKKLNAPSSVIESQQKKCNLVQDIVNDLNKKNSKEFFYGAMLDVQQQIDEQLLSMTTDFVDSDYDIYNLDDLEQNNDLYRS